MGHEQSTPDMMIYMPQLLHIPLNICGTMNVWRQTLKRYFYFHYIPSGCRWQAETAEAAGSGQVHCVRA
jgi:hypothetical protein